MSKKRKKKTSLSEELKWDFNMTREELKHQWYGEAMSSNPQAGMLMSYTEWLENKVLEKEKTITKEQYGRHKNNSSRYFRRRL